MRITKMNNLLTLQYQMQQTFAVLLERIISGVGQTVAIGANVELKNVVNKF
jgi:hypothetical protein